MLISGSLILFNVQGVLERNLCIDLRTIILRHGILHRLEVEEIKRIRELIEELANSSVLIYSLFVNAASICMF